jgi:hypothetical protein
MIARIWRGWARGDNVARYRRHFEETVRPHLAELPGFCGCLLLEEAEGDETAITAITLWRALGDIHAFAGDDIVTARIEPAARAVLSRFEGSVRHCAVGAIAWPQ